MAQSGERATHWRDSGSTDAFDFILCFCVSAIAFAQMLLPDMVGLYGTLLVRKQDLEILLRTGTESKLVILSAVENR